MPRVIEPTLIRSIPLLSVNAAGGSTELDFDFGNLEGARILGVQYGINLSSSLTGLIEIGLNFTGSAAGPTASDQLRVNESVFADLVISLLGITAVGFASFTIRYLNLIAQNIDILSNIALQAFNSGGVARTISVKVYYKRLLFSQRELGAQLAVRR